MKKYRSLMVLTGLLVILFSGNSCSKKIPILYKDGNPLSISEYEKIAQKEFDAERYSNAIKAYEAIIKNYPENPKALAWANYEIGFLFYIQKDYEKAENYLRKVLNEYQEPAAKKLSEQLITRIEAMKIEKKNKRNVKS